VVTSEEIFNYDGYLVIRFLFVRYLGQKPLEDCIREGEEAIQRYEASSSCASTAVHLPAPYDYESSAPVTNDEGQEQDALR
jgi:hypothetical protein